MSKHQAAVWHTKRRRSWWDGSIEAWCGAKAPAGAYREDWFGTSTPACPDCRKAKKAAKGRK